MGRAFDPTVLMNLTSSLGDGSDSVVLPEDEVRRIGSADLRRKCAGLKLAACIVGMATLEQGSAEDDHVLRSMQTVLARMGALRESALAALGVAPGSPDYAAAFNSVTVAVMDLLTEEWKWAKAGAEVTPLPVDAIGKLLDAALKVGPVYLEGEEVGDLRTVRRLCVLEALPKLWGLVNLFDYYQLDRESMVAALARSVCEQAEGNASALYVDAGPARAARVIVQRMYGVSARMMCEVYKDAATRDVSELQSMPELDRSVLVAQMERTGMNYDHVVRRHRAVMARTLETTQMILDANRAPKRAMEQSYGA